MLNGIVNWSGILLSLELTVSIPTSDDINQFNYCINCIVINVNNFN